MTVLTPLLLVGIVTAFNVVVQACAKDAKTKTDFRRGVVTSTVWIVRFILACLLACLRPCVLALTPTANATTAAACSSS